MRYLKTFTTTLATLLALAPSVFAQDRPFYLDGYDMFWAHLAPQGALTEHLSNQMGYQLDPSIPESNYRVLLELACDASREFMSDPNVDRGVLREALQISIADTLVARHQMEIGYAQRLAIPMARLVVNECGALP